MEMSSEKIHFFFTGETNKPKLGVCKSKRTNVCITLNFG